MGTHPNTLLMLVLTPDGLSRKTMREILEEHDLEEDDDIKIGSKEYHHTIMEADYDESFQIGSKEGDLVFHDFLTYGYGESQSWADVEIQKNELEEWAKVMCEKYHCSYEIRLGANYW